MPTFTPTNWRGLLIPDPRVTDDNVDTTNSTFTQAGPRTGVPVDQGTSEMVLQATGTKSATADLDIRAFKAGFPGINTRGGGFIWRNEASPAENWRGWNVPNVPMGHEWPGYATGSAKEYADPHVIRLANDTALSAYRRLDVATGTEKIGIGQLATAGTWTWELEDITPSGGNTNTTPGPCLLQLPSGRVLCAFWLLDTGAAVAQIQVWYSDDNGATFALYSRYAADTTVSTHASTGYTPGRLRMVLAAGGQVSLFGHVVTNDAISFPSTIVQYASDDLGASFTQVNVYAPGIGFDVGDIDVVSLSSGGVLVLYTEDTGPHHKSHNRILPDPYSSFSDATENDGQMDECEAEGMCGWVAQDGTIYAAWVVDAGATASGVMRVERSADNATTWAWLDDDADETAAFPKPRAFWSGEDNTVLEEMAACEVMGRTVMLHTQVVNGSPAHEDDAVGCLYLGGHSAITMPPISKFQRDTKQHGLLNTWISLDTPGNIAHYTRTNTAAAAESLTAAGMRTSVASGETQYFTKTGISTDLTDCMVVVAYLSPVSGTVNADSVRRRTVSLEAADGAEEYTVDINFGTADFEVWDRQAGTQIGSTQTLDTTGGIWILAALRGSAFACWYRAGGPSNDMDWETGPADASLTDGGAGAANYSVEWGTVSNPAGTTQATDWHQISYGLHEGIVSWSSGFATDDLFPRPFSANYLGLDDGVSVRAVDGPAARDDEWDVPIAYSHPMRAVDPLLYPSPRYKWRSTDETQNQIIWEVDSVSTTYSPTEMGAIYLGGINFATATLAGWNGSAWVTIATIDAKLEGTAVGYNRQGNSVFSDLGSEHTASFLGIDEAVGGTFKLDGTYFRKIERHTEGIWHKDGFYPRFYLDGITGSEPTSGTGEIWMPNVCVVWTDTAGDISKYRLTIDAQTTADGYFEIGNVMIGRFLPLKQYSHGRSLTVSDNVAVTELSDGTRYSRVQGPTRRGVTFAWREGIDTSDLYNGVNHTYFLDASNNRLGVVEASLMVLESLIDRLDGAHTPVVYLPNVTTARMTQRLRSEMMYGRIIGGVRREVVLGDERESEVHRGQTITIEEEI
jgi:hypothetical protein